MNKEELREKLAAIEHERWADWQKWVHSKLRYERNKDGEIDVYLMSIDDYLHWERQIKTPYEELSDKEKASDMEQVDRYWQLIEQYAQEYAKKILDEFIDIYHKPSEQTGYMSVEHIVESIQRKLNKEKKGKLE